MVGAGFGHNGRRLRPNRATIASLVVAALGALAGRAEAQIERPGAHPHYGAEVEPHLFYQWDNAGWWGDDGIGVGVRISVPVVENGPVKSINNNMAVGFGFDWAHFDNACYVSVNSQGVRFATGWAYSGCSMNDFWLPVVWQWSFYFSDLISAFFEPGLAIEHTRWDGGICAGGFCAYDDNHTGLELVLWLGVRFHLSQDFALVLRLGTPSLEFGPAFLM